jgi:hypothetical protein
MIAALRYYLDRETLWSVALLIVAILCWGTNPNGAKNSTNIR